MVFLIKLLFASCCCACKGWKGYLEDRRPNSAADPYKVAARIIKTVKSVNKIEKLVFDNWKNLFARQRFFVNTISLRGRIEFRIVFLPDTETYH